VAMNRWVKGSVWVSASLVALMGYLSQREWFISVTNLWVVGFFEGACLLVAIYAFADRYGDSLAEAYCGLRELGRLRKSKDQQNSPTINQQS
jgi:hypothetical protein